MIRAIAVGATKSILTSLLTEKFIINVVFMLLEWLVNRTDNDLDNRLLEHVKEAMDKDHGTPLNLYQEIKEKK